MNIDHLFMEFVHALCVYAGTIFTPILQLMTFLGEKAWFFVFVSFILLLSKKTRWVGLTAIFAILIGFIMGNVILKPMIARVRPFLDNMLYQDYWKFAGSLHEVDFSMPSGHTIGCVAFFVSLYITAKRSWKKKIMITGVVFTILMIISRTYFMHHYLTDCLVGILIGFLSAYISKFIVKCIYKFCKSYADIGIFNFIINADFFNKKKNV